MDTFTKNTSGRALAWEKAGLEWLAAAEQDGGARVVRVLGTEGGLQLERIPETSPTKNDARAFGRALAATHDAGAPAFGAGPDGWEGNGLQGPAGDQLPLDLGSWPRWGEFFAAARVAPLVRAGNFDAGERKLFGALCERLRDGEFDDADAPARVHGDLWAGNVLWSPESAVLIDPTPYGGHREDDLAALAMFGAPHLKEIITGYQEAHPLEPGWQERTELHQLHLMLLHAVLFGGGYVAQAVGIARRYA